jgi:transcriptional regulator with XRE-family HTH domain
MENILESLLIHLDRCSWPQVEQLAQATGVPFHTIAKIKRRETSNPRINTVEALLTQINQPPAKRKQSPKTPVGA